MRKAERGLGKPLEASMGALRMAVDELRLLLGTVRRLEPGRPASRAAGGRGGGARRGGSAGRGMTWRGAYMGWRPANEPARRARFSRLDDELAPRSRSRSSPD